MFARKDYLTFIAAIVLVSIAYLAMAIDPQPNGFGVLTLWISPPLLLAGFVLPAIGITGTEVISISRLRVTTTKHVVGFLVFLIALTIFCFTLEPTASLWDCSEFIASSYKLQVPHTPGTPLSLLVGRIFTMFAPDKHTVALSLNFSSAFFSSLCVYVVYHIIHHLAIRTRNSKAERITPSNDSSTPAVTRNSDVIPVLAAALGSLVLAFSDTFWFSAVEAETYGIACFFLILLVALIIQGKELDGETRERRLILIGYIGGLGYCIHPMCVLALSLLPFYWFSPDGKLFTKRNITLVLSGLFLVFLINRIVAIGTFELAFGADKFLVNNIGLPYYSGAILLLLIFIAVFYWLLKRFPKQRATTWAVVFLFAGFTPYVMLFIRSNHNPPIDETNPEDLPMIKAYMNRESYPSSPLLFGPYFDAQVEDVVAGRRIYHREGGKYASSGTLSEYRYEKNKSTLLPRLYSSDDQHVEAYRQWLNLKPHERPDFADNLNFLFNYQLGHMYMRYLLFNFAGRESDRQNADWLRPWDSIGDRSMHTSKARNQYWMLPLIAGMLGAAFQWLNDKRGFVTTLTLFLITGLVLALYLNSPPIEPRERDYIYVASFIAFSIWIGLSIAAIGQLQRQQIARPLVVVLTLGLPSLICWQNYDDHDRTGRTLQMDSARNLLGSCQQDAILFTGGDNDTFPLWYLQEVEGFRTDVRVMVLSYLNTDWYINQLRNKYYDSEPFNLTLNRDDYLQYGPNDVLYIQETIKEGIDAKRYLQLLAEKNNALRRQSSTGDYFTILPSKKLLIKRSDDIARADSNFTRTHAHSDAPDSDLSLTVTGNYATKSVLAIIDVMISNHWQRPIYFNFTSLNTAGLDLEGHVVQEGLVYRFDPTRSSGDGIAINRDAMYDNLVAKADYSNLHREGVHFNYEDHNLRIISPLRQSFNALAIAYLEAGEADAARTVMQFAVKNLYSAHLYPTFANLEAAELLSAMDDQESASRLLMTLFNCHYQQLTWLLHNGRPIEAIDRVLAQQASRMLADLGNPEPQQRFAALRF